MSELLEEQAVENAQDALDALVEATITQISETIQERQAEPEQERIEKEVPKILLDSTARFSGATWFNGVQQLYITLAGVGGIGSWAALLLSRIRPKKLIMYDNDTVEFTNMAGQFYGNSQIGKTKVDAVSDNIFEFSNYEDIMVFPERFNIRTSHMTNIAICGFDNMTARQMFYESWRDFMASRPKEKGLFIDARLAAEEFQIFAITEKDRYLMQKYEKEYLFPDWMASQDLCSYKQTSFCACMVASYMVNLLVNFVHNIQNPPVLRELPFLTRYDASTMMLKTEL